MNIHGSISNLLIRTIVVLGLGQLPAACGQRGDLYLPEPEPEQQARAGANRAATDNRPAPAAEADPQTASDTNPAAPQ